MLDLSDFASKLTLGSGIGELMQDLGSGLEDARKYGIEISMLGGGNPAIIPEVEQIFERKFLEIAKDSKRVSRLLGHYESPQGSDEIRELLAESLSSKLDYPLKKENIAITAGSQTAFFILFNAFSGEQSVRNTKNSDLSGLTQSSLRNKKILLPMVPEYIGYADQTIRSGNIVSLPPLVDLSGTNRFRYLPDMNRIEARINMGDIGAVCLSRPTNPSGNVISWADIESIYEMTQVKNIPFLIDNAYGFPFPNILFTEPTIRWRPGMVHVLSLSKLGLPGARTGIVIASKEIISVISEISAVMNLANGNLGPAMIEDLIRDGSIYKMSTNIIKPFYQRQSKEVIDMIDTLFKPNIEYRIHESLGALFLWIWFPNLNKSSREIYREAKARGVFIIDGENFFPGLEEEFSHQKRCIRLTYSRTLSEVKRGIEILQNVLT